ncbi:MAG TPA: sulfatase-like hydrolase/transferase [Kiritimatiellia bacterium]|nr:sulfatase-like hydrolase/transferase [Kiritimatiellia bacterium]HRZ12566.1 sulfatase-like hydrolase/transferase [Kiritimatiellia bacterium]HSA17644.1 sulfatase-like hydrolase/transferase [Kiritimatiellia bacterium]
MTAPRQIVLILLDGLRADALDAHPVFDGLKRRGLFCGNMVTYAPYTTASMHAILTGVYGPRNGVDSYFSAAKFRADACRTLAQYLRAAGYETAVDINNRNTIPGQGYERVTEYDEFHPDHRGRLFERHRALLAEARAPGRPYLLSLHNLKTHTELIQKFREVYPGEKESLYYADPARNEREYRGYAREMGDYVAALLDDLDRARFFRDGLLVVFSDHGCSYGERPGERMYGTYLNDYTLRTFAFFLGAGFAPGARRAGLLRTVDLLPTVLDACGLEPAGDALEPDGRSFFREEAGDRWAFVETAPLAGAHPSPYAPNYHGVVSESRKVLYHSETDALEYLAREGGAWRAAPADAPGAEEWLMRLCACSPRVNRKWLNKAS